MHARGGRCSPPDSGALSKTLGTEVAEKPLPRARSLFRCTRAYLRHLRALAPRHTTALIFSFRNARERASVVGASPGNDTPVNNDAALKLIPNRIVSLPPHPRPTVISRLSRIRFR